MYAGGITPFRIHSGSELPRICTDSIPRLTSFPSSETAASPVLREPAKQEMRPLEHEDKEVVLCVIVMSGVQSRYEGNRERALLSSILSYIYGGD